jgi:hypothetical protein
MPEIRGLIFYQPIHGDGEWPRNPQTFISAVISSLALFHGLGEDFICQLRPDLGFTVTPGFISTNRPEGGTARGWITAEKASEIHLCGYLLCLRLLPLRSRTRGVRLLEWTGREREAVPPRLPSG